MKIDRSLLRYIAFVCMFLDHFAATCLDSGILAFSLRMVGRIAFPIFCYFLVEGFLHTSSRRRYALRLFGLALVSQVPFTFCFLILKLNVVFTLFSGLLLLHFLDRAQSATPRDFLCLLLALVIGSMSEYGQMGLVLILAFYVLRNETVYRYMILTPILFLISWQYCGAAILALPLIACCSDDLGFSLGRRFNYLFYPVHLAILWFAQITLPYV